MVPPPSAAEAQEPQVFHVGEVGSPFGQRLEVSICVRGDQGYVQVSLLPAAGEAGEASVFFTDLKGLAQLRELTLEMERAVQRAYASGRITRFGW